MKYVYIAILDVADLAIKANSPANLIKEIDEYCGVDQWDPADISFYKAVEGKYAPPSTPATLWFPEEK